ncbi:trypsin-like cysteine/serine peptidase domain-containing protein [Umbelopsis sp. AD052]|nr:trypsin-like cysteine/serine peptidase domain-containing protein [Umbelopsis sp. AD052]
MYIISTIMKFITLLAWLGPVYAIQNGTAVKDSTLYPYFVTIGNPHVCGGAFLSLEPEAWVLTAAHCVYDAPLPPPSPNPYFASFGDVSRQDQHIEAITDWIVHPEYVTSSGDTDMRYDLALVKLKHPVKASSTVSRIALYQDDMALNVNTTASVMGVGYTGFGLPQPSQLLHMLVHVTKYTPGSLEMTETNPPVNSAVCHGDSGGPLIERSPWTGRPYVLGILSRIFNAYDPDPRNATCPFNFDTSTNVTTDGYVNVAYFTSWIANITGLSEQFLTTPPAADAPWALPNLQKVVLSSANQAVPFHILTCIFIFSLFYHIV